MRIAEAGSFPFDRSYREPAARAPKADPLPGLCISPNASIQDAIVWIDASGKRSVALVVDEERRIVNTITEGNVRRGMLAGMHLADGVSALLAIKASAPHASRVTATVGDSLETLIELMPTRGVRQLPIVDAAGRLCDIVTIDQLSPGRRPPTLRAVVMVGGLRFQEDEV